MLSISEAALQMIRSRNEAVHLDLPPRLVHGGCCTPNLAECPTVRFGPPRDGKEYAQQTIDGVTVYVPQPLSRTRRQLRLDVSSFLGWKRLVVEGWDLL
jgi:hypothetical protein